MSSAFGQLHMSFAFGRLYMSFSFLLALRQKEHQRQILPTSPASQPQHPSTFALRIGHSTESTATVGCGHLVARATSYISRLRAFICLSPPGGFICLLPSGDFICPSPSGDFFSLAFGRLYISLAFGPLYVSPLRAGEQIPGWGAKNLFKQLSFFHDELDTRNIFYGDWQYDNLLGRVTQYRDEFGDLITEAGAGPQASFIDDLKAAKLDSGCKAKLVYQPFHRR